MQALARPSSKAVLKERPTTNRGKKKLGQSCTKNECNSKQKLTCGFTPYIQVRQISDHGNGAAESVEPESREEDYFVNQSNESNDREDLEREDNEVPHVCICKNNYMNARGVCKLSPSMCNPS